MFHRLRVLALCLPLLGCVTPRHQRDVDLGVDLAAVPDLTACTCTSPDACSTGACDSTTGECVLSPANEGAACSGGTCIAGTCTPPVDCWCESEPCQHLVSQTLSCTAQTSGTRSFDDFSNALPPHLPGLVVKNRIETYSCATGETAPEMVYQLAPLALDTDVQVSLTVTSAYPVDMSPANTDLDLLVLDGTCSGTTTCMNAKTSTGYAGVTAATGNETVTFHALATHTYFFIVDGHLGGAADFHIEVSCP